MHWYHQMCHEHNVTLTPALALKKLCDSSVHHFNPGDAMVPLKVPPVSHVPSTGTMTLALKKNHVTPPKDCRGLTNATSFFS